MYFLTVKLEMVRLKEQGCVLFYIFLKICLVLSCVTNHPWMSVSTVRCYECHPKNFGDAQGAAQGSW
jgi:hypothetical protein